MSQTSVTSPIRGLKMIQQEVLPPASVPPPPHLIFNQTTVQTYCSMQYFDGILRSNVKYFPIKFGGGGAGVSSVAVRTLTSQLGWPGIPDPDLFISSQCIYFGTQTGHTALTDYLVAILTRRAVKTNSLLISHYQSELFGEGARGC